MTTYSVSAALAFVERHGVVLVSAKGPAPRLIDAIAGERINGNWWCHSRSSEIYNVVAEVSEADQVLVCRLVNGKLTLVHERLWPALARLANRVAPERIARVSEQHTASGRHVVHEAPFPAWVPPSVLRQARKMSENDASRLVGEWLPVPAAASKLLRKSAGL
jgi:hypothetical protein